MSIGLDTDLNCLNCGTEYEFIELAAPKISSDKEFCEICGKEVMAWHGEKCCDMQLLRRAE